MRGAVWKFLTLSLNTNRTLHIEDTFFHTVFGQSQLFVCQAVEASSILLGCDVLKRNKCADYSEPSFCCFFPPFLFFFLLKKRDYNFEQPLYSIYSTHSSKQPYSSVKNKSHLSPDIPRYRPQHPCFILPKVLPVPLAAIANGPACSAHTCTLHEIILLFFVHCVELHMQQCAAWGGGQAGGLQAFYLTFAHLKGTNCHSLLRSSVL